MRPSYAMPGRRAAKRVKNRLAKKGLTLLRFEQQGCDLITIRLIMQTKREGLGRAFAYPRCWLASAPGRTIADSVIADYVKGYGYAPR